MRVAAFVYGLIAYVFFLAAFLYAIGFVGNLVVPKTIDTSDESPLGEALPVDLALLALFGLQHSGMARPGFKRFWTRIVPRPIERATYVLLTSLILALLYWQWRPILTEVWRVESSVGSRILQALFWAGWLLVLAATFMIDHFELFGVKQTYRFLMDRPAPEPSFKQPLAYRMIRHPIMLGFLIAFWATPVMTVGHLLFATVTTVYILVAIQLEERDLVAFFGSEYQAYRQSVSMLVPWPRRKN